MSHRRGTRIPEEALDGLPVLSEGQIAELEARNGLLQYLLMNEMIAEGVASDQFKITPEQVRLLNEVAVRGLEPGAGGYRKVGVEIGGSQHVPPPHPEVPRLLSEMCDYVNRDGWTADQAIHLAAYTMWRLNWIHPFTNGNGRTSRAVSYLVMSCILGFRLPGSRTVPEMIATEKGPYYQALDAADAAWALNRLDVSEMERLLRVLLTRQLEGTV